MAHKQLTTPRAQTPELSEDPEDLIGELAWEYCQKSRAGAQPSIMSYLQRLPDDASRKEFQFLVTMDSLVDVALDFKEDLAPKE